MCKTQFPGLELPARLSEFLRIQRHHVEDIQDQVCHTHTHTHTHTHVSFDSVLFSDLLSPICGHTPCLYAL